MSQLDPHATAIAAARVAAESIFGDPDWHFKFRSDRVDRDVLAIGAYACRLDPALGETVFRWAADRELVRPVAWGQLTFLEQLAYTTFAEVARRTYVRLRAEMIRIGAIEHPAPAAAAVKLEDSIFEGEESMGTLRPEAVGAAEWLRQHAEEASAGAGEGDERNVLRHVEDAPLKSMSIGEAPMAAPVNKGGRGHKKT